MTLLELVNVMETNAVLTPIKEELSRHIWGIYGDKWKINNQDISTTTLEYLGALFGELKRFGFYSIAQEQNIAINLAVNSMTRAWPELWFLWGITNGWTETDGISMDRLKQTSSPDLLQKTTNKKGSNSANEVNDDNIEFGHEASKSTATQTGTTTTEAISSKSWKPLEKATTLQVMSKLVDEIVSRICILYDLQ